MHHNTDVSVAWLARPFDVTSARHRMFDAGLTLAEIVDDIDASGALPAGFGDHGQIRINDAEIHRDVWHRTRPKPATPAAPVAVTLHLPMGDPGTGAAVATAGSKIANALASIPVVGGALSTGTQLTLLGQFAVGSALSIGATLIQRALTSPPAVRGASGAAAQDDSNQTKRESASADGNVLAAGAALSRVAGTRKVFPPFITEPLIELVGEDEFVEVVCAQAGPHAATDIQVGGGAIDGTSDVEYEIREGWRDDAPLTLVKRQGKTVGYNTKLSVHDVDPDNKDRLADQANPDESLPGWHSFSTRNAPDEVWIDLVLPQGLASQTSADVIRGIPVRVQIRRRGDSAWINLPDLHFHQGRIRELRATVNLKWGTPPEVQPVAPATEGFVFASKLVPAQTALPTGTAYAADGHFSAGVGNDTLYRGTEASSNVRNVVLSPTKAEIYLDAGTFPKGIYDIRIKRGSYYTASGFALDAQTLGGSAVDLYGYAKPASIALAPASRQDALDDLFVRHVASVWNEHPVPEKGLWLLALKAKNRRLEQVSVVASGYVRDWDGTAWANWTTTSNPAPHYVDALIGAENIDPLPEDLLDSTGMVAWRQSCIDNGYTCDALLEGDRLTDVLEIIAGCGYARPRYSETWGVFEDRDTSADAPIQLFTQRNMNGFQVKKAFSRLPDGVTVRYRNADGDWQADELRVIAPWFKGAPDTARLEQLSIEGITDPVKVTTRATFDLEQIWYRDTYYGWTAPAEAIVCQKGSLISFSHDSIDMHVAAARVRSVTNIDNTITELRLDSEVPVWREPFFGEITDMSAVTDMSLVGRRTGVAIRSTDGDVSTHEITNPSGEAKLLTLATAIPVETATASAFDDLSVNDIQEGVLISVGALSSETVRAKVISINPLAGLQMEIVCVDEAPELTRVAA